MSTLISSKYRLTLLAVAYLVLNLFTMSLLSSCDDNNNKRSENEPNNSFETCNLVSSNTSIRGVVEPAGDSDFFCFDVEAGTMISAEVLPESPLVPFVEIYGPSQNLLDSGSDFADATAATDGRYYVVVGDDSGDGGPDYKYMLTIRSMGPEPTPTPTPTGPPVTPTPTPTATPTATPTPTPSASPTPVPMIHDVSMESGLVFVPADITINVGDTVRWTNNDSIMHDARSDDGTTFSSGDEYPGPNYMQPNDQYEFTFTSEGVIPYYCILHGAPGGIGMSGTITVESGE